MFPAIKDALRELKQGFGSETLRLDIEGKETGFTPVNVDWYARNGYSDIYRLMGSGGPAWSGETVNEQTALNLSVVWACRRIISESVAFMPLQMKQRNGDATQDATDHPLYRALHDEPNPEMADMEFREALTDHVVAGGNAFARIVRSSIDGRAFEFWPILPGNVRHDFDAEKRLVYIVKEGNAEEKSYTVLPNKAQDILHIKGLGSDGVWGYSVIAMARHSMGWAQAVNKYASKFFAHGGLQPGYLKLAHAFKTKQDEDKFLEDLQKAMSGSDNYHKWPIFPPGAEFAPWAWSPEDSQFLESHNFTVPEMCRWFLISPDMVGDMSKATLNNIEQLMLRFSKMTLTAWVTRWEKSLRRCALTPAEKEQGYFFKHNVNGLLRGDFQSRMAGYASALQNGEICIDEARDLEDRNPLPNNAGKAYHIQLNMATVPGTGAPMISEQGILNRTAAKPQQAPA